MTLGIAYWVLMLVWLAFGLWTTWPNFRASGGNLLLFFLLLIAGWKLFGPPIHN